MIRSDQVRRRSTTTSRSKGSSVTSDIERYKAWFIAGVWIFYFFVTATVICVSVAWREDRDRVEAFKHNGHEYVLVIRNHRAVSAIHSPDCQCQGAK